MGYCHQRKSIADGAEVENHQPINQSSLFFKY